MGARNKPARRFDACGGRVRRTAAVLLAAVMWAPPAAVAQDAAVQSLGQARQYAACMQLARKDAKDAQTTAAAWHAKGGGVPAMHCLSVALLNLGYYQQAAENLEALANGTDKLAAALRGDLFGQAGNAWLIAGKPEAAYRAQSSALSLRPDDADLLIDRGITLGSTANYWQALDDLNRALDIAPGRVDALVFRATAYRKLDSLELAEDDILRALKRDPDYPDALLERGMIAKKKGLLPAARADWLRVLDLAAEGPLSDAARTNLERIDVNVR